MSDPENENAMLAPHVLIAYGCQLTRWRPEFEGITVDRAGQDGGRVLSVKPYGSPRISFVLSADQARHLASLLTSDGSPS